ncbi:2,6-dihydropseudooxynicotine hydrolase [Mycena sanguinolenta]|uniref:2,6-dihydropseudooxynicotine hydrolase n=1 Tax=Mycena sanguinolenta TaxID=230812 RepID=A0A8H6YTJ2_9AGAR|nr:2,6-dihydropseudooxynicotine hydrolase [Mycena sanguinolenta]
MTQKSCSRIITLFAALVGGVSSQIITNATWLDTGDTLQLSADPTFHFSLLDLLGMGIYRGSDAADVLGAANAILPSDFTSFNSTFAELAARKQVQALAAKNKVNARDTFFQAASYWRQADFFLHGNWSDPLINMYWENQTACFNTANAALPVPGVRVTIPTPSNFSAIGIFYAPDNTTSAKPTLLVGNGYDGSQEDMYHQVCVAALERGWNCMTYEGPGQPTVRREQNIGFIADWEKVVTPVVDYLANRTDVDMSHLALLGISMGGYLAARAAAFEPRIKALIVNPGIVSVQASYFTDFPDELLALFDSGNQTAFDAVINALLLNSSTPSGTRWGIEQGLWSFHTESPFEFFTLTGAMNLTGLYDKITMPTWTANSTRDTFFPNQSVMFATQLQNITNVTLITYDGPEGYHCQVGASTSTNRDVFEWLEDVFE